MRKVAKSSFGEDLIIIAKNFERADFIILNFDNLDVSIGYFIFDGFINLNRDVFVGFFVVSGAPLMSFAVVADFDQDLGV